MLLRLQFIPFYDDSMIMVFNDDAETKHLYSLIKRFMNIKAMKATQKIQKTASNLIYICFENIFTIDLNHCDLKVIILHLFSWT